MDQDYSVKSLARAMKVLECFSVQKPELGVTEIARALGMQKSTICNILSTFEKTGYVVQDPETSKYHLGTKILHLSYIVNRHLGLRDIFLPYLHRIAEAAREACYFGILSNDEVLYIEAVYPSHQQQTRNILGERAPLYCTGLGKAMLAYMPPEDAERIIGGELTSYTSFTLCDPVVLRDHLDEIRRNGYAMDNMEHEFGVRCVAVPVFGANGQVMAAVSVSGPSPRFDHNTVVRHAAMIAEVLQPLQHCL